MLGQTDRVGAKSSIIDLFSLVAPQPLHLAKKSPINTNSAFQWAQNEHRMLSLSLPPPNGCSKTQCPKFAAITPKRYERGCQLLITFHIGSRIRAFDWYRPRWSWITLNGVMAVILRFSLNSIAFQGDYVIVIKDKAIMSVKYRLPLPVFHFWPKLIHSAARSLR